MGFRNPVTPASIGAIPASEKGVANGVAQLGPDVLIADDEAGTRAGARIRTSANQSIPNNVGAGTVLTFDLEDWDVGGYYNPASPSLLTVPTGKGGKYHVTCMIRYAASATGWRWLRLLYNGATSIRVTQSVLGAQEQSMVFSDVRDLGEGDNISFSTFQNSGGSLDILAGMTLTLTYLGE